MQVKGFTLVKGHPLENDYYIELFEKSQPEQYESYKSNFHMPNRNMVLIEIKPKRLALFKFLDPEAGIEQGIYVLNVEKKESF